VAWAVWNEELEISYENLSNLYASNTAALAVGCIVLVPISLKYGRRPMYLATTLVLALSAVWMALQRTFGDFIGNNILSGLAESVGDVLVQLTVRACA
jgi:MFS family permease